MRRDFKAGHTPTLFSRLDVSRDSRDKIVNFFARNYSPATAERAVALFLDLCGEAGMGTAY